MIEKRLVTLENEQSPFLNELVTLGPLPKIRFDIDEKSTGIGNTLKQT